MCFDAGFERLALPGAAGQMDPYWTDLLKRYATPGGAPPHSSASGPPSSAAPPGVAPPGGHHGQLPGIYPPAHLSSELLRADRERLERLGKDLTPQTLFNHKKSCYDVYISSFFVFR